ncbi:MAG: hypothetical protein WDW38_006626 [Sanguina aurantia]
MRAPMPDAPAGSTGAFSMPSGKFNVATFNDKFVDTRLGDGFHRERQKKNQHEDRRRAAQDSRDAIEASEPQALPSSTSVPHSELGVSRVQDFGRQQDRANLAYTDYKIAHMTSSCLIDPEVVRSRRQFTSIAEFEQARSESESGIMTAAEKASMERQESRANDREMSRRDAMRKRDEVVANHHAKIHQLAIR